VAALAAKAAMTALEKRLTDLIRRLDVRLGILENALVDVQRRLDVLEYTKGLRLTSRIMTRDELERAGLSSPRRRKTDAK
jgi:hypothetical protein